MKRKKITTDALEILHNRFFKDNPKAQKQLIIERQKAEIASEIYILREQAGLTQKQLAKRIGTTQSVISRLEDADYRGHSLEMLRRIAAALNCRIEIRIVPEGKFAHTG
jgi:ribosome-binding protein aMBF1 (putative translation factor)